MTSNVREDAYKKLGQKRGNMGKNAKDVTIFTTNTCAYCMMVKRWLKSKGVNYCEVNLDENPDRQQEALEISGALTVPVTVVTKKDDSKSVVVGYNIAQLAPALS